MAIYKNSVSSQFSQFYDLHIELISAVDGITRQFDRGNSSEFELPPDWREIHDSHGARECHSICSQWAPWLFVHFTCWSSSCSELHSLLHQACMKEGRSGRDPISGALRRPRRFANHASDQTFSGGALPKPLDIKS